MMCLWALLALLGRKWDGWMANSVSASDTLRCSKPEGVVREPRVLHARPNVLFNIESTKEAQVDKDAL